MFTFQKPYQPNYLDPYQTIVQDHNRPKALFGLYHFEDVESNYINFECHQFDHQ